MFLIENVEKRFASAATQAAEPPKSTQGQALVKEPVKVTKLDNGVVVVSLENGSPVTRIAAVVNAGARDETAAERGVSHGLRVFSNLVCTSLSLSSEMYLSIQKCIYENPIVKKGNSQLLGFRSHAHPQPAWRPTQVLHHVPPTRQAMSLSHPTWQMSVLLLLFYVCVSVA